MGRHLKKEPIFLAEFIVMFYINTKFVFNIPVGRHLTELLNYSLADDSSAPFSTSNLEFSLNAMYYRIPHIYTGGYSSNL